jgi:hypothetical protein
VAATESLALGDTGFSDLATPDVPRATRIEDFTTLKALSGLVCKQIKRAPNYGSIPCEEVKLNIDYFDTSLQRPFDRTPGFNALAHYATLPRRFQFRIAAPKGGSSNVRFCR